MIVAGITYLVGELEILLHSIACCSIEWPIMINIIIMINKSAYNFMWPTPEEKTRLRFVSTLITANWAALYVRGMNRFADRWTWSKKTTRISDFEDTLNAQWFMDFLNISAWIMDFACFEVRIAEINLAVCFNFFLRTRLDYSSYQQHAPFKVIFSCSKIKFRWTST